MKKILWAAMIPAAVLLACNGNRSGSDTASGGDSASISSDTSASRMSSSGDGSSKMGNDTTDRSMTNNKTITDKDVTDFVQKAANVGMMEVELGNYAVQQAKSQRVKDFGSMMVTDHTKAGNELKSLANSNNIQVPATLDAEHQAHVDMLKKKTGAAFDKDYIDMMVNGHKETITTFKKASSDLKEDAYKAFATMTLPVLQKHLDSAQAIRRGL